MTVVNIPTSASGYYENIVTQARQAQRVVNKMQMSPKLNPQGFVQPLGKVTGAASEFQKSMDASAARVFAFGAAVGIINAVSDAFTGLVQSAAEVEKSLKDVQVVMEATDSVMQKFGEGLFDVARNTATSFNLVADSAIELARQGLSAEETLARVNSALILSRLSGLDTVKSTESLTAAINSFNKEGITHEQIVNRMANVDAAFAVSSADLAEAISRAGAVAQASGVQFNELAAIVTAVQQRTARGGSVIGNGFKSIFTRIKRSRVREVLEEIGVATQNIDGSFRSSISILLDYAKTYNTLTDAQKAYTAEQIAGVFQIQNLQALIQDLNSEYSVYNNALGVANRTTDEATKRNQELNKTLDAIFKDTALSVKELGASLGNLALSGNFKEILTTLGSFAKTINDLFSEEEGSEFAKNLVKGISNFLTGPGLVLLGAAFIKIIALVGKFAKDAFKDLLGINLEAKRQESLQMAIGVALANNSTLYQKILAAGNNTAKQEQIVLNTIKQETAERIKQEALIKRIAASSALVGIGASEKGFVPAGNRRSRRVGRNTLGLAQGFLPAFAKESMDIRMGVGGARKTDKAVGTKIKMKPGQSSDVVVNTGEWIVKNYQNSGADAVFNRDMAKKYGLPEGARKVNAASGLIPNFANQAPSSNLRPRSPLKSTKTVTYTAAQLGATKDFGAKSKISRFSDLRDSFTGKVKVERMPQDNAYFAAKANSIKEKLIVRDPTAKDGSIKYKVDQRYKQLLQKQYKGLIDDGVYRGIFTSAEKIARQPAYSGEQPKRLKDLFRNLVGKSKGLVGENKARTYLRSKPGTEDVSFIRGNDPFDLSVRTSLPGGTKRTKKYEQKTKIEQNIAAVIKKGANSFLGNLVNMQETSGQEKIGIKNKILDNVNLTAGKEAMFRGGLNMLVAKDTKVSNRPLKPEGNLAGGFIPSFVDRRTRQQKIKDVLSDPANKGIKFNSPLSKPKTLETVKKGMGGEFQKMWIESYLKDGRAGDYQMLMKMGYNPDELLNLRKHFQRGGDVNIKTLSKGFIPNFNRSLGVKRSFAWRADGGKDWYTQFAGKSAEMKDFVNWAVQNKKLPQSQLNKLKQQVDKEASSYERSYWDQYNEIQSGNASRSSARGFYGTSATSARPLPGNEKMRLNITDPKTKLFLKKDTMNELINEFKNSQGRGFVPSFATGGVITSKGLITTQQIRRLREGQYIKDKQTGNKIYLNQFEVQDQSAITGFKAKFSNEKMQAKQQESRQKRNQLNTIDASRQATMLVATNNLRKKVDSTITPKGGQTTRLKYRVEGIKKANLKNTESKLRERMESLMINESQNLARELSGGQSFSANNSIVKNISNAGSIGSAAGAVFETAISSIGNNKLFTKNNATFDISGFPDPALKKLFGYYTPFADAKIGLGPDTKRDFNEKLLKLPEIQKTLNRDQTRQQGRTALSTRKAFGGFSGGYIPNFAKRVTMLENAKSGKSANSFALGYIPNFKKETFKQKQARLRKAIRNNPNDKGAKAALQAAEATRRGNIKQNQKENQESKDSKRTKGATVSSDYNKKSGDSSIANQDKLLAIMRAAPAKSIAPVAVAEYQRNTTSKNYIPTEGEVNRISNNIASVSNVDTAKKLSEAVAQSQIPKKEVKSIIKAVNVATDGDYSKLKNPQIAEKVQPQLSKIEDSIVLVNRAQETVKEIRKLIEQSNSKKIDTTKNGWRNFVKKVDAKASMQKLLQKSKDLMMRGAGSSKNPYMSAIQGQKRYEQNKTLNDPVTNLVGKEIDERIFGAPTLGSRIRAFQEKSGGIDKFLRFDNNPIILEMRKELKIFEREINKARVLGKDGLYGKELEAETAKMVSALNERKKQIQETKIKIRESFFSSAGIAKKSLAKKGKSNISFRDVASASGGQFDYYFNQMSKGYIPSFSKYMPGVSRRKHGGFYSKSEINQIEKAKEKLNEGSGGIILRGGKVKDNNMPFGELKIEEIKLLERNSIKFGGLKQELAKKVADLYLKSYRSSGIKAISDPFLYNKKSLTAIENKYDPFMTSRSNAFAKGYIPGFANPIIEAVSRESSALRKRGIGENKIRLEQDDSLKNRMNPMGLAVTNKVDEPMGVAQGIKRAKKEGKDPKKYGMSKGYIPNFRRGLFSKERLSQGASMGIGSLAFAGPLLQQQLFPEEPTSALGGAASGALTGASYGALLGLPGAAAGAGIGGAVGLIDKLAKDKSVDKAVSGLVSAQEKIKKEFKDIQALNAYKDGLIRLNTALEDGNQQEYINSQEQIKNALQDVSDPEIINRINKIADSNLKYSEKINLVTNAIEKAESRFDSFKKTLEFAKPSVQRESKQSPFLNFLSDANPFFNSNLFERDVSSFGNDLAERRFKQTKSEENLGVRAKSTQRGVQLSEIIRERAKVTVDDLIEDLRSGGERSSQISLNLPEEFRNDASSMEIEEIKSNAKIMIALRREAAKFEQENIKEQIAILSSAGSQNVDSLRGLEDAREFLKGLSALEGLDLDTQEIISREILSSGTLLTASQQELAKTFKNLGAVIDGTNSGIEAINLETLKAQPRFKTAQEKARSILRQSARMSKAFSSIDQTLSFAASRIEESISLQKDYFSRVNEMATNIGIQGSEEGSRKRFEIERQAAEKSIANETQQNLIKTILSFAQPDSILDREEILNGLKDTSGESTSVISKEQKALRESFRKETSQITQGIYALVDEYQKGSISMQELVKRSTEFATSQGGSDFGPASELSNKINQELIKSQKNLEDSIRRLTKEAAIEKLQRAEKTISEFGGRIFQAQELGSLKETSARAGIDPITGPLLELKDSFETALSQNLKIDRFTATKASEAEAKLALRSQFSSVDLGAIGSTTAFDEKYNIAMANLQSLSGSLNDEVLSTIRQKVEQSFADQKQASLELQEFIKSEGMSGLSEEQSVVKASIDTAKNTSDMVAQLTTLTQSFGSFERTISGIASVLNSPTTAIQEQGSVAGLAAGGDQATQKIDQLSIIGSEVTESVLGLTEQMKVFSESLNTSLTEIPVKLREQLEEVVIKHTHQVSGNLNVEFNTSTLRATMGSVLFSELQNILTRPIVLETLTAALKSRGFLNLTD